MSATRVFVVPGGWPADMIADVVRQGSGLELVETDRINALPALVSAGEVDCVITSLHSADVPTDVIAALRAMPRLIVLGVVVAAGDAHAFDLVPLQDGSDSLGQERLRELIRGRAAQMRPVKQAEGTP